MPESIDSQIFSGRMMELDLLNTQDMIIYHPPPYIDLTLIKQTYLRLLQGGDSACSMSTLLLCLLYMSQIL